jgi:hypothetical protein
MPVFYYAFILLQGRGGNSKFDREDPGFPLTGNCRVKIPCNPA